MYHTTEWQVRASRHTGPISCPLWQCGKPYRSSSTTRSPHPAFHRSEQSSKRTRSSNKEKNQSSRASMNRQSMLFFRPRPIHTVAKSSCPLIRSGLWAVIRQMRAFLASIAALWNHLRAWSPRSTFIFARTQLFWEMITSCQFQQHLILFVQLISKSIEI